MNLEEYFKIKCCDTCDFSIPTRLGNERPKQEFSDTHVWCNSRDCNVQKGYCCEEYKQICLVKQAAWLALDELYGKEYPFQRKNNSRQKEWDLQLVLL